MNAIINETILPGNKDQLVLLLDINVTKAGNFLCNSTEMWEALVNIRNFKNNIFFNCLTDKQLSKYE
jgi:hypothetical protein